MPVSAPFLEQSGTPLWATLGCQQIAQTHSKPDTAQETEAEGQAPLLGLRQQSFPRARRASERHTSPGQERLHPPPPSPPGIVHEGSRLAPIVHHVPADHVPTLCALLWVKQIHQPRTQTKA